MIAAALIKIDGDEPVAALPKFALTSEETIFALGSQGLFRELRRRGFLSPASEGPLLFDVADVRRAWELWKEAQVKEGRDL
jgi:hypothetical protein